MATTKHQKHNLTGPLGRATIRRRGVMWRARYRNGAGELVASHLAFTEEQAARWALVRVGIADSKTQTT